MDYVDICPPAVVERVQITDLESDDASDLLSWVEQQGNMACTVAVVAAIAERLPSRSPPSVVDSFASSVATYGDQLDRDELAQVRNAYLRVSYSPSISHNYFLGLRLTHIDIRDHLRMKVRIDWSFSHPRKDAATWDYYLYLASLGDQDALADIAAKIAKTENGNEVGTYLASLAETKLPGVEAILRQYENDPRKVDGANGPTAPLSDMVKVWLLMLTYKP